MNNKREGIAAVAAILSVIVMVCSCIPALHFPLDAQVLCANDGDCPTQTLCVASRCVSPENGCATEAGDATADGTRCAEGRRCLRGACLAPACGDGFVDDGEECEAARDTTCRADCVRAICGDGVVDANEGCDSARADCVGCTQLCDRGFADCDLAIDNGCECATVTIAQSGNGFFLRGAAQDGDLFLWTFVEGGGDVVRIPISAPNEREVLFQSESVHFSSDGTRTWISAIKLDFTRIAGPIENGAIVDLLRVPTGGVALHGEDVFVAHLGDGIWRHDSFTGETFEKIPTELCSETCELIYCGGGLIVLEGNTHDGSFVQLDGNTRLLFQFGARPLNLGCTPQGEPIWRDGRRVVVDDGAAGRTYATLPATDDAILVEAPILYVRGEPVFTLVIGLVPRAVFATPYGGVRSLGGGSVIASTDEALFLTDPIGDPRDPNRQPFVFRVPLGVAP